MEIPRLRANLKTTLEEMRRQTGKVPGGPTSLCHRVMLGALTGAEIDFRAAKPIPEEQLAAEQQAGLVRYPVMAYDMPHAEVVPAVLQDVEPSGLGIDAVLVSGRANGFPSHHIIAVVPDQGAAPYYIVDSLTDGALAEAETTAVVQSHIDQRFDQESGMRYFVVPDEAELARREGDELELQLIPVRSNLIIPAPISREFLDVMPEAREEIVLYRLPSERDQVAEEPPDRIDDSEATVNRYFGNVDEPTESPGEEILAAYNFPKETGESVEIESTKKVVEPDYPDI